MDFRSTIIFFFAIVLLVFLLQVSGKDGIPSDPIPSMSSLLDSNSSIKGETDQDSVGEHGVYYQPTSCYNYYYPG